MADKQNNLLDDRMYDNIDTNNSICSTCSRLTSEMNRVCEAFPQKIPDIIWSGKNVHTSPVPGDQGILYRYITDIELAERRKDTVKKVNFK